MTEHSTVEIQYKDKLYSLPYFQRKGDKGTLLMLHGLGGAKENFWWSTMHPTLIGYNLIAFDNPGTGNSTYYSKTTLNNDDLVEITNLFVKEVIKAKFFLLGASMGGLTMLKYFEKHGKGKVQGLINVEGNLSLEDCMFSSKVIAQQKEKFLNSGLKKGLEEMRQNPSCGFQIIADNVELNTDPISYYYYSFQTVSYSKTDELLEFFIEASIPKIFIHGDKNGQLSYIPKLKENGIEIAEVHRSDHFLFYDNPIEFYKVIGSFISSV